MNFFVPLVQNALAATIPINSNIPFVTTSSVPGLVQGFYLFALSISGILAFGAIVYGGVRYATGRGNPSSESEGKSWITSALLGLLLLAGAYIILQTINPQLVSLQMHGMPPLATSTLAGVNVSNSGAMLSWACIANNNVVACSPGNLSNCSDIATSSASPCWHKQCMQVETLQCGTTANPTTQNGGTSCSYYTDLYSCNGAGCQWTPNALAPAGGTCAPPTAQGTVQNGGACSSTVQCASGLTCVQYNHTCSALALNDSCDAICNSGLTCSSTSHTCVSGGPPVGSNSACTGCPPAEDAACGYNAPYCVGTCSVGTCTSTPQTTICSSPSGKITVPVVKCQ